MNLGEKLRLARENKNLKQVDVSKHLNINNKTISGYENSQSTPDIETLKLFSMFYGVNINWLLDIKDYDDSTTHPYAAILKRIELLNKKELGLLSEFLDFVEFKRDKGQ